MTILTVLYLGSGHGIEYHSDGHKEFRHSNKMAISHWLKKNNHHYCSDKVEHLRLTYVDEE